MEKKEQKTKVIGGGENEKVKPKPEIVKKIVDDWEDEDEEEHEKRRAAGLRIFLPNIVSAGLQIIVEENSRFDNLFTKYSLV